MFKIKKGLPHLLALASALAWLAIAGWHMHRLDPDLYENRDDGIITLSHAKNFVDHGFIGVNEAGERVEGYSSPLQFLVFTVGYSLSGAGYSNWIYFQVLLCTFLLGGVVYYIFREFQVSPEWAALAAALAGWLMMRSWSALAWHLSGMENNLTHLMYGVSALVLLRGLRQPQLSWAPVLLLFAASLSRFESIFHIGMWTAFFAGLHYLSHRNFQSLRWLGGLAALWIAGMGIHYFYFGDTVPNTAHSQGIDLSKNLGLLFHNLKFMVNECAQKNFAYLFLPAFLIAAVSFRNRPFVLKWMLLAFPLVIFVAHVLLFAAVRLDPARTNTFVTEFAAMALLAAAAGIEKWKWAAWSPLALALIPLPSKYFPSEPAKICCSPQPIELNRSRFKETAAAEGIRRPFVASPDLGCTTFDRDFHVTDLGMLGTTFFAHYKDDHRLWNEYIFTISRPDIIEIHGVWCCNYPELFHDPRWKERYQVLPQYTLEPVFTDCQSDSLIESGFFIRKDIRTHSGTSERAFLDAMTRRPAVETVLEKIEDLNAGLDPAALTYLPHMIWRFMPELRRSGKESELIAAVNQLNDRKARELCLLLIHAPYEKQFHQKVREWIERK